MIDENDTVSSLARAFDTKEFRQIGHKLIDQLSDHLDRCKKGQHKVISFVEPSEELEFWKDYQFQSPTSFFHDLVDRNIHLHHKNFIGHQVSSPAPITALTGLMSDMLNVGMGIYEMGSAGTAIERVVVKEFCKKVGFDEDGADGILTSGGTLANLTALLGARASLMNEEDSTKSLILVSEQAHFCIERAAMTMGMSAGQVVKIATTDDFRINLEHLKNTVEDLLSKGERIMCIVACACSTSTGSYDDISAIADICEKEKIWLHVDGAHGGAAVFSKKYKHLCQGIDRADSVIIDAHKMMLTPALATVVLFKRASDSYRSLSVEAAYLFSEEAQWYDLAKRTYETTKYMIGVKIFLLLKYYGEELIDEFVTRQYDLTRSFYEMVISSSDFEVPHRPMSNILCFRIIDPEYNLNHLNTEIRREILEEGKFYIVQTTLNNQLYLRTTIMNPFTSMEDLSGLLETIKKTKNKIMKDLI